MLGAIKDFFLGMANVITSLIDFVVGIVQDLVYMVKLLTTFIAKLPQMFSWLPASVVGILLTIFGIVVVYKIMGREG